MDELARRQNICGGIFSGIVMAPALLQVAGQQRRQDRCSTAWVKK